MHLNAHTVAQTVGEIGTISGICDDLPRGIIHHMRLYTGARGRHRGLHGRLDNRMHLHEPFGCRTHHCHAGDIAGIAIFAAANIHHHRITGLQQRLAGLMMGERAIAARTNDGKQRLHALPFEAGAHDLGHVQLGHAHLHLRPRRLHRHICGPRICLQHRIFIRILAHPQRTNGCGCELPRGTGQRILHKCCEIRAHRLVQDNRLRGLRTRCAQQILQGRIRAIVIGPKVKRQIGVLARAISFQRGHQKTGITLRDTQQQRPLVGVGAHAQKPRKMRAGAEHNKRHILSRHDRAKRL